MDDKVASVIIINFNGKKFLENCLKGLYEQNFPIDQFEIIVVDNGSVDGSIEYIKENFNEVILIENGENLGFALANNIAFQKAKGNYLVLLNNDTFPTKNWLSKLISTADSSSNAGIISGKTIFYYDQLHLSIKSPIHNVAGDSRVLGVMLFSVESSVWLGNYQYLDGFYGIEKFGDAEFRWTNGDAVLGIPVDQNKEISEICFKIKPHRDFQPEEKNSSSVPIQIFADGVILFEDDLPLNEISKISIALTDEIKSLAKPVIQNAGSYININGFGRDRGAYINNNLGLYETDNGQYEKSETVFAACGANMLIKKELYEKIGGFEEEFFAYYEDTEYSWRAWINGWKVIYEPQAVIRHIHCGTSKEWSPLFLYLTDRNRLAMLTKYGKWNIVFKNFFAYFVRVFISIISIFKNKYFIKKKNLEEIRVTKIKIRVLFSYIRWLPKLLFFRLINFYKIYKFRNIVRSLYGKFN